MNKVMWVGIYIPYDHESDPEVQAVFTSRELAKKWKEQSLRRYITEVPVDPENQSLV